MRKFIFTAIIERFYIAFFALAVVYLLIDSQAKVNTVLGASTEASQDLLASETTISAKTAFDEQLIQEVEIIPFETKFQDNKELEIGTEKVLVEGKEGTKTFTYLVTSWFDEQIDSQLVNTETILPIVQVVERGTKVVWKELETEVGKLKYWKKLHVWATKYDGNCYGCRGLTFSGTVVRKGVCAVDPKVISLGTNFYVEGYGLCRSEDIGGAIKGYKIDLGFEDASKVAWGAAYTNVYLLTSAPEN